MCFTLVLLDSTVLSIYRKIEDRGDTVSFSQMVGNYRQNDPVPSKKQTAWGKKTKMEANVQAKRDLKGHRDPPQ